MMKIIKKLVLIISLVFYSFFSGAQVTFTGYLVDEESEKMKGVTVNLYQDNELLSTKKWNKKF